MHMTHCAAISYHSEQYVACYVIFIVYQGLIKPSPAMTLGRADQYYRIERHTTSIPAWQVKKSAIMDHEYKMRCTELQKRREQTNSTESSTESSTDGYQMNLFAQLLKHTKECLRLRHIYNSPLQERRKRVPFANNAKRKPPFQQQPLAERDSN